MWNSCLSGGRRARTPLCSISQTIGVAGPLDEAAAAKHPKRAPPPPKASRIPRPKAVRSEPSAPKPKAGNKKPPKRAMPMIERLVRGVLKRRACARAGSAPARATME